MKLISILLVALIIVMAIMLPQIFFTVSETEVGIVTRKRHTPSRAAAALIDGLRQALA